MAVEVLRNCATWDRFTQRKFQSAAATTAPPTSVRVPRLQRRGPQRARAAVTTRGTRSSPRTRRCFHSVAVRCAPVVSYICPVGIPLHTTTTLLANPKQRVVKTSAHSSATERCERIGGQQDGVSPQVHRVHVATQRKSSLLGLPIFVRALPYRPHQHVPEQHPLTRVQFARTTPIRA